MEYPQLSKDFEKMQVVYQFRIAWMSLVVVVDQTIREPSEGND